MDRMVGAVQGVPSDHSSITRKMYAMLWHKVQRQWNYHILGINHKG
jgi:hypothetical protein